MTRRHIVAAAVLLAPALAFGHAERQEPSPLRPGPIPDLVRVNPNQVVVCKPSSKVTRADHKAIHQQLKTATGAALAQAQRDEAAWHRNSKLFKKCTFEHIQEAVNAVGDNTDILVMPGVYREEPSRKFPETSTGDLPDGSYSFTYHLANPNDANLIAILGKKNITIEGTGADPEDVLIDTGFAKDIGIRCDMCTGFIVRNLWQRDANEHGIYVLYSDGYIFDRTRGSYNKEYSLFAFASDNGLFTDCVAEGGGDSALYIGGHPDAHLLPRRFSSEVRRCIVRHSPLGFSGTQGNSVWMHDNEFTDNAIGISYDSENDHQNFPQRWSVIEDNLIHDNNFDVYAGNSDVPVRGPGYDFFRYPVGTGMWIVGGTDNVIQNNFVYNNSRFGMLLARNPLEQPLPSTVERNQYIGNIIGTDPDGNPAPNLTAFPPTDPCPPGTTYCPGGSDFIWDETGNDNCWGPHDPRSTLPIKTDPPNLANPLPIPGPCPSTNAGPGSFLKLELLANCAMDTSVDPPVTNDVTYPCPWGSTNDAPYQNGDEQECGNGVVNLGEDCDPGYGGGGGFIPADTCETLGHGSGTLACSALCIWDTSGCAAIECAEYGATRLQLRSLPAPSGDDALSFRASELRGAVFDPATEEVSFVMRDDEGLVHVATIPAGSPGWSSTSVSHTYNDPNGTFGDVTRIQLLGTPTLASLFKAFVQLKDSNLGAATDTRTANAVFRVGNDCWSDAMPCAQRGRNLGCRARSLP